MSSEIVFLFIINFKVSNSKLKNRVVQYN